MIIRSGLAEAQVDIFNRMKQGRHEASGAFVQP